MQKEKGLVSIIIPVYKTGELLAETLQSVIDQSYGNFEILAIDDGSKDETIRIAERFADPRIHIRKQENQGMAQTRNNGLGLIKGEFVLFLDHDDLLGSDFILNRVNYLNANPATGFVGGPVETFPKNPQRFLSAAVDIEEEVLFFHPNYLTTPSGYIIRSSFFDEQGLRFNTALSSTADRFLLLQLGKLTKGARVENGTLFYRISENGFSQLIKPGLIIDNERLYSEMKTHALLPEKRRSQFKAMYFYMLAGGFAKVKYWGKSLTYLCRSFFANPIQFSKRIIQKSSSKI